MPNHNPKQFYIVDSKLMEQVGPMPAFVHAVLAAYQGSDGATVIPQQQVAEAAGGISVRSVIRAIKVLCDAGLLKVEHQYSDNRQQVSRYQVPTRYRAPATFSRPTCGDGVKPQVGAKCQTVTANNYLLTDESLSSGGSGEFVDSWSSTGLRPVVSTTEQKPQQKPRELPGSNLGPAPMASPEGESFAVPGRGDVPGDERPQAGEESERRPAIPPMGTRMPVTSHAPNLFEVHSVASWLVMYFEVLLFVRDPKTRVSDKRRSGFHRTAVDLVRNHGLAEVVGILRWLFAGCGGDLPEQVKQDPAAYMPAKRLAELNRQGKPLPQRFPRRVTNLHQVATHYDQLVALMRTSTFGSPAHTIFGDVKDRPHAADVTNGDNHGFASMKPRIGSHPDTDDCPSLKTRLVSGPAPRSRPPTPTPVIPEQPVTPWVPASADGDEDDEESVASDFFAQHPVKRRIGPQEWKTTNMSANVAERRARQQLGG